MTGGVGNIPTGFKSESVAFLVHLFSNGGPDNRLQVTPVDNGEEQVLVRLVIPNGRHVSGARGCVGNARECGEIDCVWKGSGKIGCVWRKSWGG